MDTYSNALTDNLVDADERAHGPKGRRTPGGRVALAHEHPSPVRALGLR